ncbi:MAG: hypothetical protein HY562_06340 [Ignavibacteriales bacterium]|nr:hypothetical protein [Ignavibacteriales bacterium]
MLSCIVYAQLLTSGDALGGPPLISHPIQIGNARSLPFGNGPHGAKSDYDRSRLIEQTLELLTPDMPILVRMETLRRATLYASGIYRGDGGWKNQSEESWRIAYELLSRLMARVLQANAGDSKSATAWFDVGYLMACYEQANVTKNLAGYEFVKKALALSGNDAEMEFACAVVTVWPKNAEHRQHVQRAKAAMSGNSLLAANFQERFGGEKAQ